MEEIPNKTAIYIKDETITYTKYRHNVQLKRIKIHQKKKREIGCLALCIGNRSTSLAKSGNQENEPNYYS